MQIIAATGRPFTERMQLCITVGIVSMFTVLQMRICISHNSITDDDAYLLLSMLLELADLYYKCSLISICKQVDWTSHRTRLHMNDNVFEALEHR